MKKTYISLITKSLIIIFAVLGLIVNLVNAELDGYSSAASRLLYFTNLSNIFVLAVAITFLALEVKRLSGGADLRGARMYLTKLVSVVSITLTGVIFCAVLAQAQATRTITRGRLET